MFKEAAKAGQKAKNRERRAARDTEGASSSSGVADQLYNVKTDYVDLA